MAMSLEEAHLLRNLAVGGSLSAAGRALGITQQAASARLAALERSIGATLAERLPTGARLTTTGRLIATWASEMVEASQRLDEAIATLTASEERSLQIASSLTIVEHLLPDWLLQLRAHHGSLTVHTAAMNSTAVIEAVRTGVVDIGFTECPNVPANVEASVLARDEVVVVAAPGHPLVLDGAGVALEELSATPLIVRERGSGTRSAIDLHLQPFGGPTIAAELPTGAAIRSTVQRGNDLGALSILAARDDLRTGRLAVVRITDHRIVRPLAAIWREGSELGPYGRELLDIARTTFVD